DLNGHAQKVPARSPIPPFSHSPVLPFPRSPIPPYGQPRWGARGALVLGPPPLYIRKLIFVAAFGRRGPLADAAYRDKVLPCVRSGFRRTYPRWTPVRGDSAPLTTHSTPD